MRSDDAGRERRPGNLRGRTAFWSSASHREASSSRPATWSTGPGHGPEEPGGDLARYLRLLRDKLGTVVAITVLVFAAVVAGTYLQEPTYRATGIIEVQRPPDEVVPVDALFQTPRISSQYLETQYELLTSQPVLRRAAAALPAAAADPPTADDLVHWIEGGLIVDPMRGSNLVRISFDANDPAFAAAVVNAVLDAYIAVRIEQAGSAVSLLAVQVDSARVKLAAAEARLNDFVRANELFFLARASGESEDMVNERLRKLQQQLTEAEADIHAREAAYDQVRGRGSDVLDSDLLRSLSMRIADLRSEHAKLSATFTDDHPAMRQVTAQLRQLEALLGAERRRLETSTRGDYDAAVRRHQHLREAFEAQKAAVNRLAASMTEYRILKRDVDSQQQLYSMLQKKREEAQVSAALAATEVGIIGAAEPPEWPIRPVPARNLPLGAILGVMLGVGFAILREGWNPRVKRVEEIDAISPFPVMGLIPSARSLSEEHRRATMRDAFGALRTSVLYYGSEQAPPSILVTSPRPGEGKTTVSVNLATSLARLGKRVLLIDADTRRPAISRQLGLPILSGLAEYLAGRGRWRDRVVQGPVAGLDVIPAGAPPENPAELLSSPRMEQLVREAEVEYDHLVIDSPGIFINAADARVLSALATGVLLVVRSGATPREAVRRVIREIPNLLGIVLNDCSARDLPAYYGSYGRETRQPGAGRPAALPPPEPRSQPAM